MRSFGLCRSFNYTGCFCRPNFLLMWVLRAGPKASILMLGRQNILLGSRNHSSFKWKYDYSVPSEDENLIFLDGPTGQQDETSQKKESGKHPQMRMGCRAGARGTCGAANEPGDNYLWATHHVRIGLNVRTPYIYLRKVILCNSPENGGGAFPFSPPHRLIMQAFQLCP